MTISIRRPDDVPDGTPMAVSLRSTADLTTGNWRTMRPQYVTRSSPCNLDCPAGTDVRTFLAQAAAGEAVDAWRTILQHNPLPGVCGRVCYHPCETGCNRAAIDQRVAVHAIERAVADEAARRRAAAAIVESRETPTGQRVAIIGSGPAGLSCAYHLARQGHTPVIFEAAAEPGGMLRYGIPAYRLPREILAAEIDLLEAMGVTVRPNMALGRNLGWPDLVTYDAVFVAVGTQQSKRTGVPGADLSGVRPELDLLREVNGGGEAKLGRQVIVVGGGNTALDAARVAIRQGARATVVYRRSREEMPAHPDEVAQAEIEGVRFMFHAAPVRFQGWRGVVRSVLCQRMKPGAPDASGRRSPEPIPGDTFAIPCSDVLTAIGEELEQRAIDGVMEVARGRLAADRWGRTPMAPLFAGGDAATGAGTVVEAIGSGRRAAGAVHAWLTAGEVPPEPESPERVTVEQLNLVYFRLARRSHVPMLHYEVAVGGFREVAGGLDWGQAAAEAGRCLTCGSCTQCGNCVVFCPDAAVHPVGAGYEIDYAHCKGCGICVEECPRGAMALVAEEAR